MVWAYRWHSDVACLETPAAVNTLYAADYGVLPGFGDTLFANMEHAWDFLDEDTKSKLR